MTVTRSKPDQFLLRLPEGLKERIRARAEKEGRSTNEEIIRVLEESLNGPQLDMNHPDVQEEMVRSVRTLIGGITKEMQEEAKISNGLPLLMKRLERYPNERAEYDSLSEEEQDEYVRDRAHALWLEHLQTRTGKRGRYK